MTAINFTDLVEFPACDLLGFSLDFTTASPLDVKSVISAIKRARRIIQYYPDEDTRRLEVDGTVYDVPRCIGVSKFNQSNGNYVTYRTGSEASTALNTDTALSARYLAVSSSTSVSYAIDKTYRREDQWAMYSFNADTYLASLQNYADLFSETALARRLEDMQPIGDGSNKTIVQDWKDFFASWGSHVIINSAYGARFQLNVWASNSDSSVNQRFSTSVTAAFNGIVAGGQFDSSVKKEEQYKTFSEFMQKQVSIMGGDPELNYRLTADPTQYDLFIQWAGSVAKDSAVTGLNVVELWVLMKEAAKKDIREAASRVMDAYNYIVQHPQPYKTPVTFDIQSDWAEFNLLSPEGVIIPDTLNPFPEKTVASNTRVQWGKEYSHQYERKTLRFYIVNDGSPIDFSISHGSNGASKGKGRAEAILERASYLNDKITDNVWNTMWFYQKQVALTPATTKLSLSRTIHSWDDVLASYLKEIGAIDWL